MKQVNSDKTKVYREILGQVIREIRIQQGFSQRLLADEYGIIRSMICRIEQGQNDSQISSLVTISEVLGIKLSELIAKVEKKLPEGFTVIDW